MNDSHQPWTHMIEVLRSDCIPGAERVVARGPLLSMLDLFPRLVQSGAYAVVKVWETDNWDMPVAEFDGRGVREVV